MWIVGKTATLRLLRTGTLLVAVLLGSGACVAQSRPCANLTGCSKSERSLQSTSSLHEAHGVTRDEGANLARAEAYYRQKNCRLALAHYAHAGDRLREDPDAVLHYARCALESGGAARIAGILALLAPSDGARHFAAGEVLAKHQDYARAAAEFGIARKTYRDPYTAGYDQTLAYYKAADYSAAINTANELLNQGYRTAELADLAGDAYLKNHQPKEAYNALRLATGLDPKNEDSYVDLCSLSLDLDDYDRGIEIANVGLAHLPGSVKLHLERGALRAMKGEFDEAERDFDDAAKLAPDDVSPKVSRGVMAMQRGHLDQSVDILRHAAALAPANYLAQYWFAEALLRSGATPHTKAGDEALSALEASVRANPGFWHSQADLGKTLLERGSVDSAIRHLETAASLNPASTAPLYLLAQAYRRKGDEGRAQQLIARVSKMQADDREAMARSDLKHVVAEGTAARVN